MRVILVPGFTQTSRSWTVVTAALGEGAAASGSPLRVEALEVPHGLGFEATADALASSGGRGLWVGYSMGGRLALQVALAHRHIVDGLVLVSSTAGLADAAQRAARRRSDGELARTIEEHGVGVFLERWLAQPMFASVPPDAPGLAERRSMAPERLAHQLRALGQGAQPSLWERLSELSGLDRPVVLVAGGADAKYRAVAAEMARRIPGSLRVSVPGGHAVPLEAPAALAAEVLAAAHRRYGTARSA